MNFPRRLTILTYTQQFVSECIVIYPLYALMFSERSGLSTHQISLLLAWWLLVILLSELPTGILADRFSKKHALVASNLLKAGAFGVWLFAPSFYGYAVGFLVWGIGCALNSGAFQAYLYEALHVQESSKQFTKVYSRSQSLALIGMVVGYLTAATMATNYTLLLWLSIGASVVSAMIAAQFPVSRRAVSTPISQLNLLKGGLHEVKQSSMTLRIIVTLAIIAGISQVGQEFTPLYYNMVGIPSPFIAPLLAVGLGFSALLAWMAHRLEHKNALFQISIFGIAGVILLTTSFYGTITAMLGMLIFMRLMRLSSLVYEAVLQHNISEKYRATIGSIPMFISEALSVILILGYGGIAALFGDTTSIRALAILTLIAGLGLLVYWQKHSWPNRYPAAQVVLSADEQPGMPKL